MRHLIYWLVGIQAIFRINASKSVSLDLWADDTADVCKKNKNFLVKKLSLVVCTAIKSSYYVIGVYLSRESRLVASLNPKNRPIKEHEQ